jgi:hypothetical protein
MAALCAALEKNKTPRDDEGIDTLMRRTILVKLNSLKAF